MLEATVGLLLEKSPDDITIREIGERAGHHHRFISGWFGSKAGLYLEALGELAAETAAKRPTSPGDEAMPFTGIIESPELRAAIAMMDWLLRHDREAFLSHRPRIFEGTLRDIYVDRFGLDPATAALLTQRMIALGISAVLFPDLLELDKHRLDEQRELEMRICRLLAADGPADA